MAFTHTLLDEPTLGPAVQKVLGPGAPAPLRMMVARGLAPLPPRDLVVALYQLWVDTTDPKLSDLAGKTASELPPPVLMGAFGDPRLPPGVLDFLGRKLLRRTDVLEALVQHPAVDDQTLAALSRVCPESVCDLLSENQVRWLRCPAIVENLYQNPACRMSVVHRMLELADRQGVVVRLPNMEEIRRALAEEGPVDASRDDVFRSLVGPSVDTSRTRDAALLEAATAHEAVDLDAPRAEAESPEAALADPLAQKIAEQVSVFFAEEPNDQELHLPLQSDPADDRTAEGPLDPAAPGAPTHGPLDPNDPAMPSTEAVKVVVESRLVQLRSMRMVEKIRAAMLGDALDRAILIRDSNKLVSSAAIKSPKIRENEVVGYSSNRSLSHEVIRYIGQRREWLKLYAIKLNLVCNPKTPLAQAMTLLGYLHPHDVRKVARSKNIPTALATAAKRKVESRK